MLVPDSVPETLTPVARKSRSVDDRVGDVLHVACLPWPYARTHNTQLMKQGGGDDEQLCAAWGKVGAYYTERGKWGKAVQYFKQAKDLGMMAECYYRSVVKKWVDNRCAYSGDDIGFSNDG